MLLSSSNRMYQPYPLLSYFSVVVRFVFIIIVQFMMSANSGIRFGLKIVFVCVYITPSHYHHCANLSEDIELIKCMSDIICRVWVRLSIFSQLSIIQCMGPCVFNVPIPLVMIEKIYILCIIIIIKSDVWTIIHCLGLGHETMAYAVCLCILLSSFEEMKAVYSCCFLQVHVFQNHHHEK